ncbi:MAG: alpha/beta fold hydrolase [Mycobacteriaceae bacterium]
MKTYVKRAVSVLATIVMAGLLSFSPWSSGTALAASTRLPVIMIDGWSGNIFYTNTAATNQNPIPAVTDALGGSVDGVVGGWAWFSSGSVQKNLWPFIQYDNSGYASLDDSARNLAAAVRWVKQQNNAPRVHLVGYSMGGLVARACVKFGYCGNDIDTVVTIGTPNRGAAAAAWSGLLPFCWGNPVWAFCQMAPNSQFMSALNSGDETPGNALKWVSITGVNDSTSPQSTSALRGSCHHLITTGSTDHNSLPTNKYVGLTVRNHFWPGVSTGDCRGGVWNP